MYFLNIIKPNSYSFSINSQNMTLVVFDVFYVTGANYIIMCSKTHIIWNFQQVDIM